MILVVHFSLTFYTNKYGIPTSADLYDLKNIDTTKKYAAIIVGTYRSKRNLSLGILK